MNQFSKIYNLKKFNTNLLVNFFAISGQILFGFFIFLIIVIFENISYLGVFAQLYSIFVIYGLFASLGINEAVLSILSLEKEFKKKREIILSSLISGLFNAVIFASILYFSSDLINFFFKSLAITENIKILSYSIFFFIINKIFYSVLNALKIFFFFSFLHFIRPVLIFVSLSLLIYLEINSGSIALVFLFSEVIIFLINIIYIKNFLRINTLSLNIKKIFSLYHFGFRVFLNSLFSESFIRIDILMLGYFLNDNLVGIYAFASLFFEGVYQFSIVVRNVLNPDLGKLYFQKKLQKLINLMRYSSLVSFFAILTLSTIITIIYPLFGIVIDNNLITQSFPLLKILLLSVLIYSFIIPEENILIQIKQPFLQSCYMSIVVFLNILLNYFLIQKYGLFGAAFSTLISFIFAVIIFNLILVIFTNLKRGLFFIP